MTDAEFEELKELIRKHGVHLEWTPHSKPIEWRAWIKNPYDFAASTSQILAAREIVRRTLE